MRRTISYALFAAALVVGSWLPVACAGEAKEKPAIEQILDILLQRGQITPEEYRSLQEKVKQEQAAGKEPSPAILAGIEKGRPFLRSADDNFRIELGGRLQTDFDAAEDGTRTLTGQFLGSQFLIRRARIDVDAIFYKWIRAKIQAELTEGNNSGTQVSMKDAYIDLGFMPEVRFRAGQFHVPFSLEELTSDNFIDFIERSIINPLAPSRDRGAKIYGDLGLMEGVITYNLGGFNGTGEDTSDNNGDKDVAFRLEYSPFRNSKSFWLKGLQFAGNATWGNEANLTTPAGQTIARTPNRFTFFASQNASGDRLRYGGDFAWWVGPASLKFEYDVQTNERNGLGAGGANLDDVTASGWYVSSTWVVTGEDKQRSGNVIPRQPFVPFSDQSGLGAVEIGIRWAELSYNSDSPVNLFSSSLSPVNIPGGGTTAKNGAQSLTMGVNWYFNEWTRAMLNWNYYWYDNALGTPFSCQLGSCTAAQLRGADRESWEILSRLQIWF